MTSPSILLIEDEPAIADTLVYALKTEGFSPEWRTTGGSGLEAVAALEVALVILDIGLPDGSGLEWCKRIREISTVPILFLTARADELDRVLGLELGADDYVTKPFSPREVTARVKAILRRARPLGVHRATAASAGVVTPQSVVDETIKPVPEKGFIVDEERCEIRFRGLRLELTRYEYRVLKTLLARPGKVYSRDELMTYAWEDPGASLDRTVDAHIKMLRAKLRALAPDSEPIQTHRGLGYSIRVI
ncbi:MAG TPA: two-component system response regulator CreB [Opitutaceae bacterium]|nr:two-component system response regulator CreB [Opitutaceae bacterium]